LIDPPSPEPDDLQVHFINVGQGDSILILAPGGLVALIDGGYEGMGTVEYLQAHGVKRINLMIATHPHADHIGGLVDVLHAMPVDEVVTNGYVYTTQVYERFLDGIAASKAEYREVHSGDTLQLGGLEFDVLSPGSDKQYSDINQSSIVLRLVYGATSFLFTGDAGAPAERDMLASGKTLQATILKVGHHGSHTASSPEFLRAVQPVVAVYSAGKNNPYGHPHASTLENLARVGAKVYGTDVDGTVVVTANKQAYTISTRNGGGPLDLPKLPTTVVVTGRPSATASTKPTAPASTMTPRSGSAPTATALALRTRLATTTPTATDRAGMIPLDGNLALEVVSLTSPARRNGTAALKVHTEPGADCTITVMYKSGPSVARGLEPKIADRQGNVSWSWKAGGNTTPGTWKVIVTSSLGGQSAYKEIPFQVIR
jgi:competence protein ComEC